MKMHRTIAIAAAVFVSSAALASTPQLVKILPRGAQQGTEVDVSFDGQRLKDAQEVILYDNGLTVTKVEATSATQVKVHLKIDKQAPLGEHRMRLPILLLICLSFAVSWVLTFVMIRVAPRLGFAGERRRGARELVAPPDHHRPDNRHQQ